MPYLAPVNYLETAPRGKTGELPKGSKKVSGGGGGSHKPGQAPPRAVPPFGMAAQGALPGNGRKTRGSLRRCPSAFFREFFGKGGSSFPYACAFGAVRGRLACASFLRPSGRRAGRVTAATRAAGTWQSRRMKKRTSKKSGEWENLTSEKTWRVRSRAPKQPGA